MQYYMKLTLFGPNEHFTPIRANILVMHILLGRPALIYPSQNWRKMLELHPDLGAAPCLFHFCWFAWNRQWSLLGMFNLRFHVPPYGMVSGVGNVYLMSVSFTSPQMTTLTSSFSDWAGIDPEPCPPLLRFTQPRFTSYHSAHIRLSLICPVRLWYTHTERTYQMPVNLSSTPTPPTLLLDTV